MTSPHDEPVGSVGDEAAKLLGALADWAGDHAGGVGERIREVNEHLATGDAECLYCPVCRTVHAVRQASPEVRAQLATAASAFLQAAAGLMAAAGEADRPPSRVQHIDLDDLDDPDDDPDDGPDEEDPVSLACGIDVGGTKILGGVVDADGSIVEELRVESPATDAEEIEKAIQRLVAELASRHEIAAVGVGAAGYIDKARSTVMFAPNIAWRDVNLKADLEMLVDLPVVVENDANAAAWGEFTFGAGHDVEDLLLVTVGTGIGGGIVHNGDLLRGAFGIGAEIGHMRVVPDGLLCGCGNRGCFEQYASGSALVREARSAARAGSLLAQPLLERAGGDAERITGPLITEAARAGDAFAVEQLAGLGRWLGEGIASLTAVLDPAVVVLGGGVSEAGDLLLAPVRAAFQSQLTGRGHRPVLEIRKARLGNRAGLIGAADLARR